jgi:hypothetical protein
MKKLYLAFILPCVLFSFPAVAEQAGIQPQTQGEVTFVSGGVGGEEQRAMQAMKSDYNLSLLFSVQGTGEYLSDVKVTITDTSGNVFLDTVAEGPKLFANLKAGRYLVTANQEGRVVRKTATVGGNHTTSLSFTWSGD